MGPLSSLVFSFFFFSFHARVAITLRCIDRSVRSVGEKVERKKKIKNGKTTLHAAKFRGVAATR